MRQPNLLRTYIAESVEKDWRPDWNDTTQRKCCIQLDPKDGKYFVVRETTYQTIGAIYMPEGLALRICEGLNRGEIKF
jgi:hypothetical protein